MSDWDSIPLPTLGFCPEPLPAQQFSSLDLKLNSFLHFSKETWARGCHSAEGSSPGWPTDQHPGHAQSWECLSQPSGAPASTNLKALFAHQFVFHCSSSPPVPSEHCDLSLTPRFPHGHCTLNYWLTLLSPSWYELAFPRFSHNLLIRCWEMMFGVWKP